MSVQYDEFSIERRIAASPARVFRAFAEPEAKWEWFGGPSQVVERSLDFRVGGDEIYEGIMHGGSHRFVATYHDIVQPSRIIYSYELYVDDVKLSVSQTTITIEDADEGALLTFREYGAYLDGHEDPALRREGTEGLLDMLVQSVEQSAHEPGAAGESA